MTGIPIRLFEAFLSCLILFSCEKTTGPVLASVKTVRAVMVKSQEFVEEISSFGTVSYRTKVDISAPAEGIIKSLPYREGDFVPAGGIVAQLRNPQYELARDRAIDGLSSAQAAGELASARLLEGELSVEARMLAIEKAEIEIAQKLAELEDGERKLKDQERLFEAGGVAEEQMRSARLSLDVQRVGLKLMEKDLSAKRIGFRDSDLVAFGRSVPASISARKRSFVEINTATLRAERTAAVARAAAAAKELASAQMALKDLVVIAASGGVLGARYLEEGERVKLGDKLVTIMDTTSVFIIFPVRENEAGKIAPGMPVKITVDALPDLSGKASSLTATVDSVSPAADPGIGAFTVKARLENPGGLLKPGMFARAAMVVGKRERMGALAPSALMDHAASKARVIVVSAGTVAWRNVELGREADGIVAVVSGLREGELVLDPPDPSLKEGEHVEIAK